MSLTKYWQKRDFKKTAEPKGKQTKSKANRLSFVIQKHDASRLHYDFRLELNGVLLSWAVPKGPSLDPAQKRLAMHVEDHPVDYGSFEGIIPQGEYGGGTVMLWDRGEWKPLEDPEEGYQRGKLKFTLEGEKLHGDWMLVRRGGSKTSNDEEKTWFLFKEKDEHASARGDILKKEPLSVATGRDLDQIASDQDRVWGSNNKSNSAASAGSRKKKPPSESTRAASRTKRKVATKTKRASAKTKKKTTTKRSAQKKTTDVSAADLPGGKEGKLPKFVKPQLATLAKTAPAGDGWLHEIKFDGYRMLCRVDDGSVQFLSRNEQDWTDRFAKLAASLADLPVQQALLDGEVVALEPDGLSSFQSLQNVLNEGRTGQLIYYVFDILHLDGYDVTRVPLEERKALLASLLGEEGTGPVRLVEHVIGEGPTFFEQAGQLGLEGMIAKRRDRPYVSGRGDDWLKIKCVQREEFVIGGYTPPEGSRQGFGALLLGYHNRAGDLIYAGRVGTGFTDETLRTLHKQLKTLEVKKSPFENLSGTTGQARGVHWVSPKLVGQVEFTNWTRDALLRHPSFQGLREDKPAKSVVRDQAVAVEGSSTEGESAVSATTKTTTKTTTNSKRKTAGSTRTKSKSQKDSAATVSPSPELEKLLSEVRLTSPDKVLYPNDGFTKFDLAAYYAEISDWIVPHLLGRPLSLVRCPEGRQKTCFFQKHPGPGTPAELRRIPIQENRGTSDYLVVDNVQALLGLVQIGAIELHVWGSREDSLEQPDRLIFDLDPDPSVPWKRVIEGAVEVRELLEELGLTSFVKTTGGKGLHVVVPVRRSQEWPEAKAFCRRVAETLVARSPKGYTSNMSKAQRVGKIFVDYLRNDRGATAIAPYSTRKHAGAPVSVLLAWDELDVKVPSDHYDIRTLPRRLAALKRDPWDGIARVRQSITAKVLKKLEQLADE